MTSVGLGSLNDDLGGTCGLMWDLWTNVGLGDLCGTCGLMWDLVA